jgi:hypothetical protein
MALPSALRQAGKPEAQQVKRSTLNRFALSLSAGAMLAGCGGAQPPIGAPGAMPQSRGPCFGNADCTERTSKLWRPSL